MTPTTVDSVYILISVDDPTTVDSVYFLVSVDDPYYCGFSARVPEFVQQVNRPNLLRLRS